MTHEPRVDKERNRIRLTEAATRAVQRDGLGVSMRAISREAGLGIATAYRHFPTKSSLVEAVLAGQVEQCTTAIRAALDEPNPWTGLLSVIDWFAELQISHPGLLRVLLELPAGEAPFTRARHEHALALDRLVTGARAIGALRQEVTTDDVRIGMMAMTAFNRGISASTAIAVRTLEGILVHGIAASPGEVRRQPR